MSITDQYSIHFAHTADWHLGRRPYDNDRLYSDFFRSANRCIKNILSNKPDFILHCGDLFNKANPDSGVRMEAHRLLNIFKVEKIPLYIIRGNHDASPAYSEREYGTILDELQNLGFINYLKDEIAEINDSVRLYGIGEYGKGFASKLTNLLENFPLDDSKINILAAHAYVKGQLPGGKGHITPYQLVEESFDYIALGHFHTPWQDIDSRIFCPGSIEHQSISEWKNPNEKEFCTTREYLDVFINEDKKLTVNKISHKVRPKAKITINLNSNMALDAIAQIREAIKKYDKKGALLHITVLGKLKERELVKINFRELEAMTEKALLCKILADVSEPQIVQKLGKTEEEAIYQLLKDKYEFSEKKANEFQPITKEISGILSRKGTAIETRQNEALELLNHYILSQRKEG